MTASHSRSNQLTTWAGILLVVFANIALVASLFGSTRRALEDMDKRLSRIEAYIDHTHPSYGPSEENTVAKRDSR
jgi:hypothetical protein